MTKLEKILNEIESSPVNNQEKMLIYRGVMLTIREENGFLEETDFELVRAFLNRRSVGGMREY